MKTLLCLLLAATLLLCGCGTDEPATRLNDFTPLTSITIVAPTSSPARLTSTRLTATGNFSGLFSRDITADVTWSSAAPAVADFTLAAQPSRLFALSAGSTTITATLRGVSATLPVTVSAATVAALAITPDAPTVAKGLTQQFSVTGTFSDATTQDLTFDASWTSSDPAVATIGTSTADKGLASTLTVGTSTIGAAFDGKSATTLLTVTNPVLQGITVAPASATLLSVARGSYHAIGHYSDGTAPDITNQVSWSSTQPAVATIDSSGTVTTLAQGNTTLRADLAGISGSGNLWVSGGNLTAITISPLSPKLAQGTTTRLVATGSFSNGTTREITGTVDWTVGDTSFADVALPGGQLAWLTTLAATPSLAPTALAARFGTLTVNTPLTVTNATLASNGLSLSPAGLALGVGTSGRFTLTGSFSDGTNQDLTASAGWSSNAPAVADARNSGLDKGRVIGLAASTSTAAITATYGGQSITANATVSERTLQNLTLSALPTTFMPGTEAQFSATAGYSDGSSADVTADATWVCADHSVAMPVDGDSRPGRMVAVGSGSTILTVTFKDKSQDLALTVP